MEGQKIGEKNNEKEPHYNFSEIAEMEPAMISLVEKLKDKIEKREYDTLISDDIGGRIPTLALRKVLKDRGNEEINTFFLPGGSRAYELSGNKQFRGFVTNKLNPLVKNRALLVTEFVDTGNSINTLARVLERAGFSKFDAAIVTIRQGAIQKEGKQLVPGHKSFCGDTVAFTPKLYFADARLGGVEKKSTSDRTFIFRLKSKDRGDNKKQEIQKDINKAREDAHIMAQRILEKVWE